MNSADCLLLTSDAEAASVAARPGLTPTAVLEKLAEIKMIDVWIPTVDQRWLILPALHTAFCGHQAADREVEIAIAEPAATASSRTKTELRNRGTNGAVGGYFVVKTFL